MIPKEQSPKFIQMCEGPSGSGKGLYALDENGNVWLFVNNGWRILNMERIAD